MRSAVIVGAGIGGLAAALALRRAGWDARIIEQAATPRELGFALALAPNALAALRELGVYDAVVSQGVEVTRFDIRRADGRLLKRIDMRGAPLRSVVLLRPALHGTLLDRVGSDAITLGRRVLGFGSLVSTPQPEFENPDPTAPPPAADVFVGADGVGSAIRRALHSAEPPLRPSGYHALRGVSHGVEDRLNGADAAVYLGEGIELGCARASTSAVYWYISLLDELVANGASATLDRCLRGVDASAAAVARAAAADAVRLDRLFRRDPLERWGRGNVTLLGDAAHPVLPHTAQGAALAMEDAVALGLALSDTADVERGLRRYEQTRAARTRASVRRGPRIAAMTTTRSRIRILLRDALVRLAPAGAIAQSMTRQGPDPHAPLRG
jgi:2-polyprenyl-6-methoxyphenol hydroxylase-like FAD-dependent oxidoreductase